MSSPSISRSRWFWLLLVPLLFLHLFIFVQLPVSIYLESEALDTGQLPAIVMALLMLAAISLLGFTLLLGLLGWPLRKFLGPLLLALALSYWLIDSFFGRTYPALDGAISELALDSTHGWTQLLVFGTVLAVLLATQRRLEGPLLVFLAMLTLLNAFWVARSLASLPDPGKTDQQSISAPEFFTLSRQQNVLIILMDTFQSEYLEEVLTARPDLAEALRGFSYFPDTLGVATSTFMSVPAIHSGKAYEPSRTMSAYFENSIRKESVVSRLGQAGYQAVVLNPIRNVCPEHARCLHRDELLRSQLQTNLGAALHFLDISLMRSAPEPWKNAVLNEGSFLLSPLFSPAALGGDARVVWDDARILQQFGQRLRVTDKWPHATFLHLMNTHPPYVLAENCQVVVTDTHDRGSRASALQQAACGISQLVGLLQVLQAKGIYDQTMVIVLGDHGSSSAYADASLESRRLDPAADNPEGAARLVGSANPLLLIKNFAETGPLRYRKRLADLTDIPATICGALAECDWEAGVDLFSTEATVPRQRTFMNYRWEHKFWELGYIPELEFYSVSGPVADWASWERDAGVNRQTIASLELNEADDPSIFGQGWGLAEISPQGGGVRWVAGQQADLLLDVSVQADADFAYQLNMGLWVPDFNPEQAIWLELNGHSFDRQEIRPGLHDVKYRIPAGHMVAGINRFSLHFDQAQRPNAEDLRRLAVVVRSLNLEKIEFER